MLKKKNCLQCNKEIEYEATRGKDRKYCGRACQQKARNEAIKQKWGTLAECKTEGCSSKANRVGIGLCEACYMRVRRKGTTDKKVYPYKTVNPAGYIRLKESGHVLSDSGGTVYEHRYTYHKHYGDGPFNCHWCGKIVTWVDMHVDHVDSNVANNEITNLVASCPICNQKRGRIKMKSTCRAKGVMLTHEGQTKCLSEWAVDIGITVASLRWRLDHGWSVRDALCTERGVTGPR